DESGIVFGTTDGQVTAVDLEGKVQATWNSRAPILASVAIAGDIVLVVNQAGMLYALDRNHLEPIWQIRLGGPGAYLSSPVVAGERIYVGTPEGFLGIGDVTEVDRPLSSDRPLPDSGAVLWRYPFDGRIALPPGVTDSTILLAGRTDAGPALIGLQRVV